MGFTVQKNGAFIYRGQRQRGYHGDVVGYSPGAYTATPGIFTFKPANKPELRAWMKRNLREAR